MKVNLIPRWIISLFAFTLALITLHFLEKGSEILSGVNSDENMTGESMLVDQVIDTTNLMVDVLSSMGQTRDSVLPEISADREKRPNIWYDVVTKSTESLAQEHALGKIVGGERVYTPEENDKILALQSEMIFTAMFPPPAQKAQNHILDKVVAKTTELSPENKSTETSKTQKKKPLGVYLEEQ